MWQTRVSTEAKNSYRWANKLAVYITAPKLSEHGMGQKPYLNNKVTVLLDRKSKQIEVFVDAKKIGKPDLR